MVNGKKIVIVDDNKELADELKDTLESAGYNVLALSDSRKAFVGIKKFIPELILLDLKMPHKSGIEVAEELRSSQATKGIPIIGISGHYKKSTGLLEVHGFKKLLTKPVDPEELFNQIKFLTGA